tara:strand:- start:3710 stop:4582 length:873 start_codon:yes stop_codon:yes gene_type:complete
MSNMPSVYGFKKLRDLLPVVACLAALTGSPAMAGHDEILNIGGTGAALGGMKLLADAYMQSHPDINVVVLPSLGSSGGVKALLANRIDFALTSRDLKDAERAEGVTAVEYARTPVVFSTHLETAADNITLAELPLIYNGENATWPDGSNLRLIMRPPSESDMKLLASLSPQMEKSVEAAHRRGDLLVAINDQDNATALEKVRGSLGLSTLAQITTENRRLKILSLDGQQGSVESLRDGEYGHAKILFLVTKPIQSALVSNFVTFMRSDEGAAILSASGHLVPSSPVKPGG